MWLQMREALLMWPELQPAASDQSTLTQRNLKNQDEERVKPLIAVHLYN